MMMSLPQGLQVATPDTTPDTMDDKLMYKETETTRCSHGRESVTSTTMGEDELWNMDLSDILGNESTRRTSSSLDDLLSNNSDHYSPMRQERSLSAPRSTTRTRRFQNNFSSSDTMSNRGGGHNRHGGLKRSVSFDKVMVREFERVLVDNPPTTTGGGPSLGLGWNYTEKKDIDLDKFETKQAVVKAAGAAKAAGSSSSSKSLMSSLRSAVTGGGGGGGGAGGGKSLSPSSSNNKRRDLLMSVEKREKLAKKLGYSQKAIENNVKMMDKIRRQRKRTVNAVREEELERDADFLLQWARQLKLTK